MRAFGLLVALVFSSLAYGQPRMEDAFPNLTFESPIGVEHDGVDASLLYVVERAGVVKVVVNTAATTEATDFLDIQGQVSSGGEKGLLGLAFHPDYAANGFFYVQYSVPGDHRSRLSRFSQSPADVYPPIADEASEVVLLEVDQPFSNHNGGGLAFGPDGYLYVSLGDGGSGGDPEGNGQKDFTLLGSILRLDVDGGGAAPECGEEANYTIPSGNALADGPGGACDEIYSWGLRNPWRFSFDRANGDLWIADVGQNRLEEINRGANGANFGWNTMEGTECFNENDPRQPLTSCDQTGLTLPVWEYSHALGCSVTGGYVYRGTATPELQGRYIYGDYCSGRIWALDASGDEPVNELLDVSAPVLTSFGEDTAGELYLTRFNSFSDSRGKVYRLTSSASSGEPGGGEARLRLDPAWPNPFRGTARISFALAERGLARLTVYDVLGREVDVLHDGVAGPEAQTVQFSAGNLAAGLYFIRLDAGTASRTRALVLAR